MEAAVKTVQAISDAMLMQAMSEQTVVSIEMVPCEICTEVAVPLKGQRPCPACRDKSNR